MSLTASNVRVGVSGEVYVAESGQTAPVDAVSDPAAPFGGLGYVSDDGITETLERDTDDIVAWQNAATVRSLTTSAKALYQFTLIETTVETVEFAYGTEVTQTATHGSYEIDPAATGGVKSFIIDVIDGANIKRIFIEEGELAERGDTVYASGEPIGYEATIVAYTKPQVLDTSLKTAA